MVRPLHLNTPFKDGCCYLEGLRVRGLTFATAYL